MSTHFAHTLLLLLIGRPFLSGPPLCTRRSTLLQFSWTGAADSQASGVSTSAASSTLIPTEVPPHLDTVDDSMMRRPSPVRLHQPLGNAHRHSTRLYSAHTLCAMLSCVPFYVVTPVPST
ncbi:hypothetical protein C8Q74DRAFT_934383 [Fomes fomentarius]|nr:hypothetical protein C8Q74DRAFT_934383 [Fomes fomentarius]